MASRSSFWSINHLILMNTLARFWDVLHAVGVRRCRHCGYEAFVERLPIGESCEESDFFYRMVQETPTAEHRAGIAQAKCVDERIVVSRRVVGDGGGYVARVGVENGGELLGGERRVAVELLLRQTRHNFHKQFVGPFCLQAGTIGGNGLLRCCGH